MTIDPSSTHLKLDLDAVDPAIYDVQTQAPGHEGRMPLDDAFLQNAPSGDHFGWVQNVGMGLPPDRLGRREYLILSTQGGLRAEDGSAVALGYHTGHWEVGLLVREAAETFMQLHSIPFAAYVSDPCDGRSQGTHGMMDSLAYRNDAAVVLRRLIRSLPTRSGVMGIGTCDKGLPAIMLAIAGAPSLPGVVVPGGVTLPPIQGEDAGKIQTIGVRYIHGELSLEEAAELGCKACASPGGGCQFLGTAATSQVVAEALGLAVTHSALAPSGQAIWLDSARRSAQALVNMSAKGVITADILTDAAIHNAMVTHAAFGGSTNLLIHLTAIAHTAGLRRPNVDDWTAINRATPRLVDVLPNGPVGHPTIRAFMAGGVPEVMLHLRELGLLQLKALTVNGQTLDEVLDGWQESERRQKVRARLQASDGVDPEDVIMSPNQARRRGLTSTVTFPKGNLVPDGSVVKSTAIDPSVVDEDGVYRKTGPARVFTTERAAIAAIKAQGPEAIQPGDVIVLIGRGPMGSGMEETAQLTSSLKYLDWGKEVALITDARFSGFSTGACIGHAGPEALAGGPVGRVRDGDLIRIVIDRNELAGSIDLVGCEGRIFSPEEGTRILAERDPHPGLAPDPNLPDDTRLWAALQAAGGGVWGGCVYDTDAILELLEAGKKALSK